jgi:pyruvate/2-oxoglutarate dehydrogenase complex dihydrolipoamide acyltransferase (E2) component
MIPHVTQFDDADITDLEDLRVALNNENAKAIAAGKAGKLTMLAFMIKASVAALKKYPTSTPRWMATTSSSSSTSTSASPRTRRTAWWCRCCATPTRRA